MKSTTDRQLTEEKCAYCHTRQATRDGPLGKRVCVMCLDASEAAKDFVDSILTPDALERIFGEKPHGN